MGVGLGIQMTTGKAEWNKATESAQQGTQPLQREESQRPPEEAGVKYVPPYSRLLWVP